MRRLSLSLSLQFMPLIENKSAGAIFGTFICRFHISTALSVLNVPLQMSHINGFLLLHY